MRKYLCVPDDIESYMQRRILKQSTDMVTNERKSSSEYPENETNMRKRRREMLERSSEGCHNEVNDDEANTIQKRGMNDDEFHESLQKNAWCLYIPQLQKKNEIKIESWWKLRIFLGICFPSK